MLPFGVGPSPPALLLDGPESLPADDDRTILFGDGAVAAALAAEIVGNPDPVVIALALIVLGGGGTKAGFAGSS